MTQKTKLVLCLALALLAAVSLTAVLGSLGVLPVGAAEEDGGILLRAVDGRVGVFSPADSEEPFLITDIRVDSLPQGDRLALTAGVRASDRDAAARLLEDYGA